jgi:hypothetical protein
LERLLFDWFSTKGLKMKIAAALFAFFALATAAVVSQIALTQHNLITMLKQEISLLERENNIEKEEIRDLLFQLSQSNAEKESIGIKHYVSGVVDTINKPDYFREIWHSGYDRGSANQQYVDQSKEKTYVDLKEKEKENEKN